MELLDRNLPRLVDFLLIRILRLVEAEQADVIAVFVVNQVGDLALKLFYL